MKILKTLAITAAMLAPATLATPAYADSAPIYTPFHSSVAVGGYDTVSYFSGKPLKGDKKLSTQYAGAKWYFSTQANLDLFKANPDAFVPQYGGYCAWALAHNKLAKGDPKYWHVENGKLYLNFNNRIQNQWLADKDEFIIEGDSYWPSVLRK